MRRRTTPTPHPVREGRCILCGETTEWLLAHGHRIQTHDDDAVAPHYT